MKLRYFIPCLMALVAVVATSCSDDNDPTYLDDLKVSTSFVSIPEEGGSATVTVNAKADWYITCCDTCKIFNHDHMTKGKASNYLSWLNIDKTSGQAGENTVTFSAEKYLGGHEGTVYLHSGDDVQIINITQGIVAVSEATCAEVLAGPDGKLFRVTGTCTSIANTTYGNWYLNDGTGEVYIYGTLDAKGQTKNFLSLGIEEGDVVTVEGPKTTYGTTVELVDVTVVNIQKSLLKVDSVKEESFPVEGGDITVYLTCKGEGLYVDMQEEFKEWLSITSITGGTNPTVKLHADANPAGDRGAVVEFKTTKDGKEYVKTVELNQAGAIVNATVADFLAAPEGATQYRLTGVITSVAKADYGNFNIRDYTGEAYVYGLGSKGDFEKLGLKVGDVVTVAGQRSSYKGSPQMASGQYENHIPVTAVSIAEFNKLPDDADTYYMVSGAITTIDNATYGNCHIKDEAGDELYVYGCYPGWGATGDFRKNYFATAGIVVGDLLTVIGTKTTYGSTIELANGIYFSHVPANK
ncbi:MAG: BACON domain-containing protein [Prevotellaceae bacterium]|nr:BACON domain-containing protein [Prevotellaceae bacterium]